MRNFKLQKYYLSNLARGCQVAVHSMRQDDATRHENNGVVDLHKASKFECAIRHENSKSGRHAKSGPVRQPSALSVLV